MLVIDNWRAAHAYPLNTFQATLRKRLSSLGLNSKSAPVGQRLKRLPSIEKKLHRNPQMKLERMQDIAGLRAVVPKRIHLREIRRLYEQESRLMHHLHGVYDYVAKPKDDGYRSVHLVYQYLSATSPEYDGLHVELQLRTQLQHAWATAVETVDLFTGQAIKTGSPRPSWAWFFKLASAAFASLERSPVHEEFKDLNPRELRALLRKSEADLNVIVLMRGFSVAADRIHQDSRSNAGYHLVVLDTFRRTLRIKSFTKDELPLAMDRYAQVERQVAAGAPLDAVLVAGGGINQLRKTYPNYFLDASMFIDVLEALCGRAGPAGTVFAGQ
ncbi:RelA/SpoT domain-containing protein [Stenotrophomonas maltophilia]|uniref:RelA/SpoT domain-containing protein n=1 Tax=Stenotrophomonas maltophilia TaxID=40324 RepID=UPI0015DF58EB|nr:RelA/SpoT domain-containing protein [Stenotrophomonas maltophilia]